jgi:hypothetical protein
MPRTKTLIQWIGHSDLRALAAGSSKAKSEKIMAEVRGLLPESGNVGPTKTLVTTQSFDEVRLLSNYSPDINKWFAAWVGGSPTVIEVSLDNPTNYAAIFDIANRELESLRSTKAWANTELCMHLSPGTPAMAAVW